MFSISSVINSFEKDLFILQGRLPISATAITMSSYQGYGYGGWYGAASPQDQVSSPSEYYGSYYQSQPLVRDLSSGASSQASTIPESPMQRNSYALYGSSPTNYSGYQQTSEYQQYYSSGQARAEESSVPRSEPYVQPIA